MNESINFVLGYIDKQNRTEVLVLGWIVHHTMVPGEHKPIPLYLQRMLRIQVTWLDMIDSHQTIQHCSDTDVRSSTMSYQMF